MDTIKQGILDIVEIHGKVTIPWSMLRVALHNLQGQKVFEEWLVANNIKWIDTLLDDKRMFWKDDEKVMGRKKNDQERKNEYR